MAGQTEILVPSEWQDPTMDQSSAPNNVRSNTYSDLTNMAVTSRGTLQVRPGLRSYFGTSTAGVFSALGVKDKTGLFRVSARYGISDFGSYQYDRKRHFWAIQDKNLYALINNRWTIDLSSACLQRTGYYGMQFNQKLMLINPYGGPLVYWIGGSTRLAALIAAPAASCVTTHYNRLIASGVVGQPDKLFASFVGDAEFWSTSPVTPDAGGWEAVIPGSRNIIALSPSHYSGFYVGTENSLHRIEGRAPSEYTHAMISGSVGNVGHRTLLNVANNILGWNDYGCHVMADTDKYGGVESPIMPNDVREIFWSRVVRDPTKFISVNDIVNSCYMTFMPSLEDDVTFVMCFYYHRKSWTWWEIPTIVRSANVLSHGHQCVVAIGDNMSNILYFVSGATTDYNADYNRAFSFSVKTQKLNISHQLLRSGTANSVRVWHKPVKSGTVNVGTRVDGALSDRAVVATNRTISLNPGQRAVLSSTGFTLGTSKLSSDKDIVQSVVPCGGNGSFVTIEVSGTAASAGPLEIYGVQAAVNVSGGAP